MTEFKVRLDDKSMEILKQISPVHSESIINYGIRLVKNTNYFKTLLNEEHVEEIQSINEVKKEKVETKIEKVEEVQDLGITGW